ncbi:hypothetical protein PAXRUDRAFT_160098 [Paxillus rubicundulus Ve08.2h10]|uniref:Uncharacterized protein n=1 Tax=Paxillus rubicundulus Ve08.2h10 TaxID=930991 RepID=A0A0D0DFL3_9AGAM|nr:hypothetical protein PAXRUDRAFT_160098 [Paxillus rubicundulus Ve08.2h10]
MHTRFHSPPSYSLLSLPPPHLPPSLLNFPPSQLKIASSLLTTQQPQESCHQWSGPQQPLSHSTSPQCHQASHSPPQGNQRRPLHGNYPSCSFQNSSSSNAPLPPCSLCLGRFPHNVQKCHTDFLWDGRTPTHCHRNHKGCLVNKQGLHICLD